MFMLEPLYVSAFLYAACQNFFALITRHCEVFVKIRIRELQQAFTCSFSVVSSKS